MLERNESHLSESKREYKEANALSFDVDLLLDNREFQNDLRNLIKQFDKKNLIQIIDSWYSLLCLERKSFSVESNKKLSARNSLNLLFNSSEEKLFSEENAVLIKKRKELFVDFSKSDTVIDIHNDNVWDALFHSDALAINIAYYRFLLSKLNKIQEYTNNCNCDHWTSQEAQAIITFFSQHAASGVKMMISLPTMEKMLFQYQRYLLENAKLILKFKLPINEESKQALLEFLQEAKCNLVRKITTIIEFRDFCFNYNLPENFQRKDYDIKSTIASGGPGPLSLFKLCLAVIDNDYNYFNKQRDSGNERLNSALATLLLGSQLAALTTFLQNPNTDCPPCIEDLQERGMQWIDGVCSKLDLTGRSVFMTKIKGINIKNVLFLTMFFPVERQAKAAIQQEIRIDMDMESLHLN